MKLNMDGIETYNIEEPIWMLPGFGLARNNMGVRGTLVTCSYRDKKNKQLYPHKYLIKTKKALKYGTMGAGGVRVHLIPFADCKVIKEKK